MGKQNEGRKSGKPSNKKGGDASKKNAQERESAEGREEPEAPQAPMEVDDSAQAEEDEDQSAKADEEPPKGESSSGNRPGYDRKGRKWVVEPRWGAYFHAPGVCSGCDTQREHLERLAPDEDAGLKEAFRIIAAENGDPDTAKAVEEGHRRGYRLAEEKSRAALEMAKELTDELREAKRRALEELEVTRRKLEIADETIAAARPAAPAAARPPSNPASIRSDWSGFNMPNYHPPSSQDGDKPASGPLRTEMPKAARKKNRKKSPRDFKPVALPATSTPATTQERTTAEPSGQGQEAATAELSDDEIVAEVLATHRVALQYRPLDTANNNRGESVTVMRTAAGHAYLEATSLWVTDPMPGSLQFGNIGWGGDHYQRYTGALAGIPTAALSPLQRLWRLWTQRQLGSGPGATILRQRAERARRSEDGLDSIQLPRITQPWLTAGQMLATYGWNVNDVPPNVIVRDGRYSGDDLRIWSIILRMVPEEGHVQANRDFIAHLARLYQRRPVWYQRALRSIEINEPTAAPAEQTGRPRSGIPNNMGKYHIEIAASQDLSLAWHMAQSNIERNVDAQFARFFSTWTNLPASWLSHPAGSRPWNPSEPNPWGLPTPNTLWMGATTTTHVGLGIPPTPLAPTAPTSTAAATTSPPIVIVTPVLGVTTVPEGTNQEEEDSTMSVESGDSTTAAGSTGEGHRGGNTGGPAGDWS